MLEKRRKKFFCVTAANAEEFQNELNKVLHGLDDPEVQFPPAPKYTAYVLADVWEREAECLEEVHMLRGDTYRCSACPYFERTNDLRRRWHYCRYHEKPTRDDSHACEDFYEQLERGTINITMEEVRGCRENRR